MAVLMNSAVKTIAIVNTMMAQSSGFNLTHRPTAITRAATIEWIQALCWVLSTYHQPRKACPNAAMREVRNVLNDIILLEFGCDRARVLRGSRPGPSTCGLFLQCPRGRIQANARRRGQPKVALPLQADALPPLPAPGREGSR